MTFQQEMLVRKSRACRRYSVKHLFPYLNADDSTSKENERGPPLVTQ